MPFFLCHLARQRVSSLSLITPLSSAKAAFSSLLTFFHWLLSTLSSCLSWEIFISRRFGISAAVIVLVVNCSLMSNLSDAMLIMNMLIVLSLWSTSHLAVVSRAVSTTSSNCCHSDSLLAAGHNIRRCSDGLLWGCACGAWRFLALY